MINEILKAQALRELKQVDIDNVRTNLLDEYLMAKNNQERQREYREKMMEAGHKRVAIWLTPKALKRIEKVQEEHDIARDAAINFILESFK